MDNIQKEFDQETDTWKIKMEKRIKKLSFEWFFDKIDYIIEEYYNDQNEYSNIEDFKSFLNTKIKEYIYFYNFDWSYEDVIKLKEMLWNFEEKYHKIIYFWEEDTVEKIKQRKKENEISWQKWKIRWYFWKILG